MKIYTEINYEFKNGELIELDSTSFDYTGEVAMCFGSGGSAQRAVTQNTESIPNPIQDQNDAAAAAQAQARADAEAQAQAAADAQDAADEEAAASSTGVGSLQGQNAMLSINKKTKGPTGAFTRGSIRIKKPKPIVVS